jgi:hypothetical protein
VWVVKIIFNFHLLEKAKFSIASFHNAVLEINRSRISVQYQWVQKINVQTWKEAQDQLTNKIHYKSL